MRPISLTDTDRAELERLHRAPSTRAAHSRRVPAVLLIVQGLTGVEIGERAWPGCMTAPLWTKDPAGIIKKVVRGAR